MKNSIQVILTLICLAGLATLPSLLTEKLDERDALFYDCEDRVSVPVVGIRTFAWCADNNTVWTGNEWADPSNFEQRRIDIYINHQNQNP